MTDGIFDKDGVSLGNTVGEIVGNNGTGERVGGTGGVVGAEVTGATEIGCVVITGAVVIATKGANVVCLGVDMTGDVVVIIVGDGLSQITC